MTRGETVTVLTRSAVTRDAHGNEQWSYTEVEVEGCIVWPTGSTEQTEARDTTTDRITVSFPYGTDVTNVSKMRVRGHLYEVDGTPSQWASPFTGWKAGVEVHGVRVTG
jgi:hypothetical protein